MGDPLLDFMNANDDPSAAEAQAALARALRRKQDLGTLGVLSGGKLAVPGQSLLGSARSDEDALMHAGVSRTARLDRQNAAKVAGIKALQDLASKKAEQSRLDSQFSQRLDFDKQKLALTLHRGAGGKGPPQLGPDGQPVKSIAERRMELKENAVALPPEWEKIDQAAPAYRTPADATAHGSARAAFEALKNHRAHAAEALKALKAAKSPAEADTAAGVLNQQMQNIAAKLRVAEGLNNSNEAHTAINTMLSLSNGSAVNLRNMANEGRLDAILDSAINSADVNLTSMSKEQFNLRRKAAKASAAAVPTSALSPEDAKALAWAKANPGNPDALEILKLHGAQ